MLLSRMLSTQAKELTAETHNKYIKVFKKKNRALITSIHFETVIIKLISRIVDKEVRIVDRQIDMYDPLSLFLSLSLYIYMYIYIYIYIYIYRR